MKKYTSRRQRALCVLALTITGLANACPSELPTTLSLSIVPGEIRGVEHMLQVNVQEDNCLRVIRPAHWHESGRFGGVLARASIRRDQTAAATALLTDFDGKQVRDELAALDEARGEAFAVEGADQYLLRWIDGSGQTQEATFAGIFQYAERYPERRDLAAFAALVTMLQDEATREDLLQLESAP